MISKKRKFNDRLFHLLFFLVATVTILMTIGILMFIFYQGIRPFITGNRYGAYPISTFLLGNAWRPRIQQYGIGYIIVNTLFSVGIAILIASSLALGISIFIAFILPSKISKFFTFCIEIAAGIPSIFIGLFGYIKLLPIIGRFSPYPYGESLLAVIVMLVIMVLPTMTLVMISCLRRVDESLIKGGYALGASKGHLATSLIIPASMDGLVVAVLLGVSRMMGEATAVSLVSGNREVGNFGIFRTVRLMTANIVLEQGYATGIHEQLLWSTAGILVLISIGVNLAIKWMER